MKSKGQISIDHKILEEAELYAKKMCTSVAALVEAHLQSLIAFDKASASRRPIGFGKSPEVPNSKNYGDLLKEQIEKKLNRGDKS